MKFIQKAVLDQAMTYLELRELMRKLHQQEKTTGQQQSETLLNYSKLNESRMKRLDKTVRLEESTVAAIQSIDTPLTWLVLTEGWCGDAAQVLPILDKMAQLNDKIELKLILRDDNLDIMDAFLTNGGRSIPKLLILNAVNNEVLGDWGPRPEEPQRMVMDAKKQATSMEDESERKAYIGEVKKNVQKWYNTDKTVKIQAELVQTIQNALTLETV